MHWRQIARHTLVAVTLLALLLPRASEQAQAFDIDKPATLALPLNLFPHAGRGIHEDITQQAIRYVTTGADANLILNLQRGVENTDITHQWDAEYHC